MRLSVFSPVLAGKSLKESLAYLKKLGAGAMELGCGGYPGTAHADAGELVKCPEKVRELKAAFADSGIAISALSAHGNAIHPNPEKAAAFEQDFQAALQLAELLGVERVITFSGCPGDGKGDQPNWVTCAWPAEYAEVLKYQWEEVLLPYWEKAVRAAKEHGVIKVCLEMHPGFSVYNPETLLRLRRAVGDVVAANFDPSHLIWQGIDIPTAIRYLQGAIGFFHAKDTALDAENIARNGVLDTKSYDRIAERSWVFRTVGWGNGGEFWKRTISALASVGYDGDVSIEHEDGLMTPEEGLEKAAAYLKDILIRESNKTGMWWA